MDVWICNRKSDTYVVRYKMGVTIIRVSMSELHTGETNPLFRFVWGKLCVR